MISKFMASDNLKKNIMSVHHYITKFIRTFRLKWGKQGI